MLNSIESDVQMLAQFTTSNGQKDLGELVARLSTCLREARQSKEPAHEVCLHFLRAALAVLDLKAPKLASLAYALLAKSFTLWKLETVG